MAVWGKGLNFIFFMYTFVYILLDAGPLDFSDDNDEQPGSYEEIEALPGPEMAPRSLSHISEASRDRESWAITQKFGTSHGPKTPKSVCVIIDADM